MEVTPQLKEKTANVLLLDMKARGFESQAMYSKYISRLLDIPFDKSAYSQIKNQKRYSVLKDTTWLVLAQYFNLLSETNWQAAPTHAYETMNTYMDMCQKHGIWRTVCDQASFGKTFSAVDRTNRNKDSVFYIDCSENSTKPEFIRALALQFGIERRSSYNQMWIDATNELLLVKNPLLILDEFGDTHDSLITLMKSLYNKADRGTHRSLGVLHIGADNLKKRMDDGRRLKKQSYAEYFSRTGSDYLTLNYYDQSLNIKENEARFNKMVLADIEKIVDMNLPENLTAYRQEIINKTFKKRNYRNISDSIKIFGEMNVAV